MKNHKVMLFLAVLVCLLAACSSDNEKEEVEPESKEPPKVEKEEEKAFSYPLTGVKTGEESNQRAIAVMINNHVQARPQSGLSKADIVYEVLAEGSITRYLAIFQSELPEKMGPIRSARPYYIDLALGYNSVYIPHGNSPEAKKMLHSGVIDHLNGIKYDGKLFKRSTDRKAPHNSYITYKNIEKGAELEDFSLTDAPATSFQFLEDSVENTSYDGNANQLKITYSKDERYNAEYKYDSNAGRYTRYSGDEQAVEYESNDPIYIDNIVVAEMEHQVLDSEGRRGIDLTSGGKAIIFQKGKRIEGEWKNEDGRIVPLISGQPVKLVPGKTWINIVPNLSILSYQE